MGARSKRARVTRVGSEFDVTRLIAEIQRPRTEPSPVYSWSLRDIVAARNDQLRGNFLRPARMAEGMRTDDALAVAYENRLAPQSCVPVDVLPASSAPRAISIATEGDALFGGKGVGLTAKTMNDIEGTLVNHGIAFANITATPREDGSRIDFQVKHWPIELVRWEPFYRCFITQVDPTSVPPNEISQVDQIQNSFGPVGGFQLPIVHGDGRWIIFAKHETYPWRERAAILSACLVWARHAFGVKDWAKGSTSHGNAKMIGEMPEGVELQDEAGQLTPQALAFLQLLQSVQDSDMPVGIRPSGAKTEYVVNNSSAWQVYNELVLNAERASARIYNGTDGALGAVGGAPGVDIEALMGVNITRVKSDFQCIEEALDSGLLQPWAAVNFGDSSLAPRRVYRLPGAEQKLLSTTDVASSFITVNEAREAAGLGPLKTASGDPDPRGHLTTVEFNAAIAGGPKPPTPQAALRSVTR